MCFTASSLNPHGYDIKDYFTVDPRFGTLDDYRELLFEAHISSSFMGKNVLPSLFVGRYSHTQSPQSP